MEISSEAAATLIAAIVGAVGAVVSSSFGARKRILDNIKILNSFNSTQFTNKELLEKEINHDIGRSVNKNWRLALYIIVGVLALGALIVMHVIPVELVSTILSDPEKQRHFINVALTCVLWFAFTWCVAGIIRWWNK